MEQLSQSIGRRDLLRGLTIGGAALSLTGRNASPTSTAEAAPTNDFARTQGMRVGAVLETLSHPLIKVWGDYLAIEGKGFGMQVSVQDGERNVQKQTSQMEAFITQKVNDAGNKIPTGPSGP